MGGVQKVRNINILGEGSVSGGNYHVVNMRGTGKIDGDLECDLLKVMGIITVNGSVKAREFRVMGTTDLQGDLSADEVVIRGLLNMDGNCNAGRFNAKGGVSIKGLLNADNIQVHLYGRMDIKDIGGGKVEILSSFHTFSEHQYLTSDTIEGDEIHLEYTRARVVRGDTIIIGPGCEIDLVEYRHNYKQSDKCRVVQAYKI